MEDLKQIQEFFSKPLEEVTKSQMLKKAKKGSYPATLVAIENGKVVAQEKVNTPQEAPAAHSVMVKKYPNAKIRLEDNTGKILNENVFVEAFKLEKALKGMGYNVKVKYLDDFGKDIFEIYFNNPEDADDDSIFYDAKKLGYDNIRVFANPQESLDEAKRPEPNYKELVKLLIMAFKHEPKSRFYFNRNNGVVYFDLIGGAAYSPKKSKMRDIFGGMNPIAVNREFGRADHHEEETIKQVEQLSKGKIKAEIKELGNGVLYKLAAVNEYNTGLYYDPSKEKYAVKAKQASKSGLDKVKDFVKKVMKEEEITVDDATEFKLNLKHLLDKHVVKSEALSDFEDKEVDYDELYSDYKYKVDEAKPKKGHGEKISKEVFAKLKGKTISYKGADYKVVDSDEAVLTLKDEDGKSKTINLRQFNISGMIEEILETIELGKQLNEKLCKKGEAYRKKRMAAGEKSSAYLSGRAVKVCKGQMKG